MISRRRVRQTMHKTPKHIARSLCAFRRAHTLGLLHHVYIKPGALACEAAQSQRGVSYIWNAVPKLPLGECTRDQCDCDYAPVGKPPRGSNECDVTWRKG